MPRPAPPASARPCRLLPGRSLSPRIPAVARWCRLVVLVAATLAGVTCLRPVTLAAAENDDEPSLQSVKDALKESESLLAEGRPAKAAGRLADATRDIAVLAEAERVPAGLRSLIDRCRSLRDDLELEGVDVSAVEIPTLKAAAPRQPARKPTPAAAAKPAARPIRPARQQPVRFASDVAPILLRHCGGCHVAGSKGGFQMTTFDQLARTGMVQPGVANASRLVEVILSGDMPRGGGKVSSEEIGVLMRWIDAGALFDGGDRSMPLDAVVRAAAAGQQAAAAEASKPVLAERLQAGEVSFASAVAPILLQQCAGCHGADDPGAGLSMASLDGLLRGGAGGSPVVKGKGAESLLVRKLKGVDIQGQRMPLGRPPLSAEQIAVVERWVDQGLKLDALTSRDALDTVAAVGRGRLLSHADLAAQRLAAARRLWKNSLPDEEPRFEQREHVAVVGNLSASRLAGIADQAQAAAVRVLGELIGADDATAGKPDAAPLVKGGIVIFALDKPYDYSAFWQVVMRGERPKGISGHAGVSGDLVYGAVVVPAGDADSAADDTAFVLAEQIAAAALMGRRSPRWFAAGAGRVVAGRVAGSSPLAQAWRRSLGDSLQRIASSDDFFGGFADPVAAADVAAGFVSALISTGPRLRNLVRELDADAAFEPAFVTAFRSPPQPQFEAWVARESARRGGRRP